MDKAKLLELLYSLDIDANTYKHYSNIQTKLKKNDKKKRGFFIAVY